MRRLAVGGALLLPLTACQTDMLASTDEFTEASIRFRIDSAYRQPDSASWLSANQSGAADLLRKPSSNEFLATVRRPAKLIADSIHLSLWKWGVRTNVLVAKQEPSSQSYDTTRIGRDTVAYEVLRHLADWRNSDSGFFLAGPKGVRRTYAKMMTGRDSASRRYARAKVIGLDTIGLVDEICVAMARKKKPFDSLYSSDFPGADSTGWRRVVLDRVRSGLLSSLDSATLFPPLPVRVEKSISVKNTLVAGGDEIAIEGAFGWHPGLVVLDALILSGSDTVRGAFDAAIQQPRRANDTSWSLGGRATVRARSRAKGGDYRLVIVARDIQRRVAVSSCSLRVQDPPAGTPRLMRVVPSGDDTVRVPFDSASIQVEAKVFNPDSIDAATFTIGGVKAVKVRDSVWSARVPLSPSGRAAIVAMRVVGKNGSPGSDYLLAVRGPDVIPPDLKPSVEKNEREVPFAQVSSVVVWNATDNHRVERVEIAGMVATSTAAGFAREVPLAVGNNLVSVRAIDSSGNIAQDSMIIVRRKDLENPAWVRDFTTHDSDVTSDNVKSILLAWKVADNHRVEKVTIGGVQAERTGGLYYRVVPVQIGETKIAMQAWDSSGNTATDSVTLRKELNPGYPVVRPATGTKDTTVAFETSSIQLGWNVLNPRSLKSFTVDGVVVDGENGRYGLRVSLPVGENVFRFQATDTTGAKSTGQVRIVRAKDAVVPNVVLARATFVTISGVTTAEVKWLVEDNHQLASVRIAGEPPVVLGNQYSRRLEVPVGLDYIRISAIDSCGNEGLDSVRVNRTPDSQKPLLEAWSGIEARDVSNDTSAVLVAWKVFDNQTVAKVEIAGEPVEGVQGIYARYVPLLVGPNTVRIVATDPSGNEASQEIVIVRKP